VLAAIAAEAAVYLAPGAIPYVLRDLRFRSFVRPSAGENRSPHLLHAETLRVEGRTTTVLVKITSDVVGRDGTPLRPNREHFKAVVELRPSGDDRPEVRYHADLPAGRKVDDRYYQQDSFVRLSGVFRAADDWHVGPDGATAHWNPDRSLGRDARDLLDRCLIPAVLLDGMARAAALQADPRQEQVPQAMATIELHRPESDGALARRHRDGLTLAYTAADGETVAITSGGIIVARMAGVDLFPLTPPRNGLTPGTRRRR
jgi:hypothetical protein